MKQIKSFIDTWISPGWRVDFSLSYETTTYSVVPKYSEGIAFVESFNAQEIDENGVVTHTRHNCKRAGNGA